MEIGPPIPECLRLSELIDSCYSRCFAIQLSHDYNMDGRDFFIFDEQDREIWGDTLMSFDAHIKLSDNGHFTSGYASQWFDELYRLICVASVDADQITFDRDELLTSSLGLTLARISPRTIQTPSA